MSGSPEFLDTNVLVYAHDASAGLKRERAIELVRQLWESRRGCLSVQVLQEFYVAATGKVRKPLPQDVALSIVRDYSSWPTYCTRPGDVVRAIEIHKQHNISFWDALIVVGAVRLGCAILWSEDLNPGQVYEGVTVRNPFAENGAAP